MNGRLDKVAMTNKLMQLKREIHYKCEIGEKNAQKSTRKKSILFDAG